MQHRITSPQPVLDSSGRPLPGWASSGIMQYNRRAIRAPFYRIKEWDWYQVSNGHLALQFTFGHASYAGQVGVTLFDFEKAKKIFTKDVLLALPFGSLGLPNSAEADSVLCYDKGGMYLRIEKKGETRTIICRCEGLEAAVTLAPQTPHALVINVPFSELPRAFYYNHKINCMRAEGQVTANGTVYNFDPAESWGLLDWGRGVWPFHNEWYWSNASGRLDGEVFGFNLGCGFGDTSNATENSLFFGGAIHKLGAVRFELGAQYSDPWRFTDDEGRLDLVLQPVYDRTTAIKMLWVNNSCHQMFGRFSGRAVLDDGTALDVHDIIGFAEHAINNW